MHICIKFEIRVTTPSKSTVLAAGDSSKSVKKVVLGAVKMMTVPALFFWVRQVIVALFLS